MEKANIAEHTMGEMTLARAPTVADIPFSSPRRSGPVALLGANDKPTKNWQAKTMHADVVG